MEQPPQRLSVESEKANAQRMLELIAQARKKYSQ